MKLIKNIIAGIYVVVAALVVIGGGIMLVYGPALLTVFTNYDWMWLYWIDIALAFWAIGRLMKY